MVTLQILVLSFQVRILVGQQDDTLNVQPTLINRFAGNDIG